MIIRLESNMSPAPVAADTQQDLQLQTLARAFEALLLTIQQLGCRDQLLQQRLEYASDEVRIYPIYPFPHRPTPCLK